jgi:hypothetical protein
MTILRPPRPQIWDLRTFKCVQSFLGDATSAVENVTGEPDTVTCLAHVPINKNVARLVIGSVAPVLD